MVYTERADRYISPQDKDSSGSSKYGATVTSTHTKPMQSPSSYSTGGSDSSNGNGKKSRDDRDDKWKYNNMVRDQRDKFNNLHFC